MPKKKKKSKKRKARMPNAIAKINPPSNAIMLPDDGQYKLRMDIPSSDGSRYYRVAFLAGPNSNYFVCSCRGAIAHGTCKHMSAMGLFGRKNKTKALARAKELGLL